MAHNLTEAQGLLAATLREPFPADRHSSHVHDWFDFLVQYCPLWSFQRDRYLKLQGEGWFATEPLKLMVRSILRDDGLADRSSLDPLEAELDYRRYRLAAECEPDVAIPAWPTTDDALRGGPALFRRLRFRGLTPDTYQDDEGRVIEISPYETVGYELLRLVDKLKSTAKKRYRQKVEQEILGFAKALAREGRIGRRPEGPPLPLLKALVAEGRELLEVCWLQFPVDVSRAARQPFSRVGIDEHEIEAWSARLALPVLSCSEIVALKAEVEQAAQWPKKQRGRPTPRRFTVWALARRFGMSPATVARKTLGAAAIGYFLRGRNPINRVH